MGCGTPPHQAAGPTTASRSVLHGKPLGVHSCAQTAPCQPPAARREHSARRLRTLYTERRPGTLPAWSLRACCWLLRPPTLHQGRQHDAVHSQPSLAAPGGCQAWESVGQLRRIPAHGDNLGLRGRGSPAAPLPPPSRLCSSCRPPGQPPWPGAPRAIVASTWRPAGPAVRNIPRSDLDVGIEACAWYSDRTSGQGYGLGRVHTPSDGEIRWVQGDARGGCEAEARGPGEVRVLLPWNQRLRDELCIAWRQRSQTRAMSGSNKQLRFVEHASQDHHSLPLGCLEL